MTRRPSGFKRDALDHQGIVDAQHVNAVAQPLAGIAEVDQDVVAGIQGRRHRIAFDANDRQVGRGARGQGLEPALVERKIGLAQFLGDDRAGPGRHVTGWRLMLSRPLAVAGSSAGPPRSDSEIEK